MLCQRSLCCDVNRIHVMGKGSAQLGSASIRDAHAPPTGSFTYLCHSGVSQRSSASEKREKYSWTHSTITHSVLLGWFCILDTFRYPIITSCYKELHPFPYSFSVFLSLTGSLYQPSAASSRGSDKWVEVTGQVHNRQQECFNIYGEIKKLKTALPAKTICNVSLRVQSSWPWLIFPWLIDLVGIYTHGFCDSTSPYTYITFPGEVYDRADMIYLLNHFLEGRIHLGSFIIICPGAHILHSEHKEWVLFMTMGLRSKC